MCDGQEDGKEIFHTYHKSWVLRGEERCLCTHKHQQMTAESDKIFSFARLEASKFVPREFSKMKFRSGFKDLFSNFWFCPENESESEEKTFPKLCEKIGNKSRLKCKVWNRLRCQTFLRKIPKWAGLAFAQEIMQLSGRKIYLSSTANKTFQDSERIDKKLFPDCWENCCRKYWHSSHRHSKWTSCAF